MKKLFHCKKIYCPICNKSFQSLGYARHRTMHYEQKIRLQNSSMTKKDEK